MNQVEAIIFIIYVANQDRSADFYKKLFNVEPVLHVPGMTEFWVSSNLRLGIMPETGIAKLICPMAPHPQLGNGIPRSELYMYVPMPQDYIDRAIGAGARLISGLQERDWGEEVGYLSDIDGHILAFAKKCVTPQAGV